MVLVVSGRPQMIADQLPAMDALVASWLPGSEGDGVTHVLYGKRPFTGKLPLSWPRSADQGQVNVGDRGYDPLFPYGDSPGGPRGSRRRRPRRLPRRDGEGVRQPAPRRLRGARRAFGLTVRGPQPGR
ncbi:hypothetical protein GCM10014713_48980 [Streptomyces purpureus]|uniref:beta-glucosidase n=1 Tax=Streptomyces purpureus TaxID=1951 RepID=A0A918HA37_9ACTN|nr:hypothetical protein GCM10014713_48980 [Streptomyces purpureus]